MATTSKHCMLTDISRRGLAMSLPYLRTSGARRGRSYGSAGWLSTGRRHRRVRRRDLCGNREIVGLDRGGFLVLLGFLNFDVREVAGPLQSSDEVGDAVDGGGGAIDGQIVVFLDHRNEPEIFGA